MKKLFYSLVTLALTACGSEHPSLIDRDALLERNNPHVQRFDSLAFLSVGNGEFAFTVDATGLQTFPDNYKKGVPLGTQSQWGWHSFDNPENYRSEEYLKEHDFGRGHKEVYACQFKEEGRQRGAANWYRMNPHRLHLGVVGLELGEGVKPSLSEKEKNYLVLIPEEDSLNLMCLFTSQFNGTGFESEPGVYRDDKPLPSYAESVEASSAY